MSVIIYILIALYILVAAGMILCSKNLVHILQLEGYKNKNYFKWLKKNFLKVYTLPIIVAFLFILAKFILNLIFAGSAGWLGGISVVIIAIYGMLILVYNKKSSINHAKKPLIYTGRVKRLFVFISAFYLALTAGLFLLDGIVLKYTAFAGILIFTELIFIGAGVLVANIIVMPIESMVKKWYFNDAKKKLAIRNDLIKIGITGSYGKTSCKYILGTILSEKYNVLVPPSSYNTPMGLTRVIREQMQAAHEVFIAEMGARHKGDIKELCELVYPTYGVITSVGPQHLETFKNIENIAQTKFELIESLPENGCAFFAADNEICRSLYNRTKIEKQLFGTDYDGKVDMRARNITTGPFGSRFDLVLDEETISCETKLLGRHNIANITGCAAVAKKLGLTAKQIRLGIRKIEPVEHRLQIMPRAGSVTVIDDAFNSNPSGVKAAMEVLLGFEGRKIVVTPGMVELGEQEEKENYEFGRIMAVVADVVYLIGPRHTKPVYDGLVQNGFDPKNITITKTLDEATKSLWAKVRLGDVILFENDLPDNYNE